MPVDHSTLARPDQITVKHLRLELDVCFHSKRISGTVQLSAVAVTDADQLALDTRDLQIHSAQASGKPLHFKLHDSHKALGSKLDVAIPRLQPLEEIIVTVDFTTSPTSTAIQFLEPAQTAGGQHPYLFTQCQAIHARSFAPCQDTPGVKSTYSAAVRVPEPLTALMSAQPAEASEHQPTPYLDSHPREGCSVFHFQQPVPIPSYLLALAVGELQSRELGPMSRVWSEPSMVAAAAHEFADTDRFLQIGTELAGEYVWGRYDLLLMPPSFPYGGMENPCLTFVTPTLLAGDRSLATVVAHEIAHSWTGNLITNATWEHFWLNEGFTVLLERKILGRLEGTQVQQFASYLGYNELKDTIRHIGPEHSFTALIPDLSGGIDPDDAFSRVPYEKGSYFLYHLQELVGGAEPFERFLKAYIQAKRYSVHTSQDLQAFFCDFFREVPAVHEVDWDAWLHSPGLPPKEHSYDIALGVAAFELAQRWVDADKQQDSAGFSKDDIKGWNTMQTTAFLAHLAQLSTSVPLKSASTRQMAQLYELDHSRNSEIQAAWFKSCLTADDTAIFPQVTAFLKEQGRMKFLRPLYRALSNCTDGADLAKATFRSARQSYHPIAAKMVAADLGGL